MASKIVYAKLTGNELTQKIREMGFEEGASKIFSMEQWAAPLKQLMGEDLETQLCQQFQEVLKEDSKSPNQYVAGYKSRTFERKKAFPWNNAETHGPGETRALRAMWVDLLFFHPSA